jgi:hypothetical protein
MDSKWEKYLFSDPDMIPDYDLIRQEQSY